MDIVGGIAAASQALGIAKALRGIEKDYDAATYKAQVVELIDALSNAKLALIDARENTAELEKEIGRLRADFEARGALIKSEGDYSYFPDDDGKPVGFPICPSCDANGRITQLKQDGPPNKASCPTCDKSFQPVTCFLAGTDETLAARQSRLSNEALARVNAQLRGRGRGRNDWMV